jgi:hypothetical protein
LAIGEEIAVPVLVRRFFCGILRESLTHPRHAPYCSPSRLRPDRHTAMIVTDLNNKPLKKTNTVYWAASGTVPLYLNAGTYRLLPYTQNQMVDRGDLQILMMAKTSFEMKIGAAIA